MQLFLTPEVNGTRQTITIPAAAFAVETFGEFFGARVYFENGYGASIACGKWNYGNRDHEPGNHFEIAVLDKDGLCYRTDVTGDVEGWLTGYDVSIWLQAIADLRPGGTLPPGYNHPSGFARQDDMDVAFVD